MTILRNIGALALVAAALLPMGGCVRDGVSGPEDPALAPGTVRVAYTIDGMSEDTRATAAEGHERALNDVHILFYDDLGSYITYQHANVTTGTSSFTFPIPAVLTPNTPYKTLIVGNSHDHVPSGFASFDAYLDQSATMTYDEMFNEIYAERNMDHSSTGQHNGGLPMHGEFIDGDGHVIPFQFSEISDGKLQFNGTARFSRSVCRLDLRHLAAQHLIIDAVKLCNYRKAGYYFHNDAPKGEIQSGLNDQTWINVAAPYGEENSTQELNAAIYAFANIVPVVQQNDKQTTYLMIRGYYQDGEINTPEAPKTKLTYYRFNMAENGRSQILRRNYRYLGIINSVKGPGADDEQGAEDAEAPMLDYDVDDSWTDDDSNTTTDDKGNFLTISRAMVTFDGYKDLAEAVKVTVKEGLSWSVEWDKTLVGEESSKFTYARVDDRQFSITTLEDNATDFTRNARLIVKATGGTVDPQKPLTATVSVMQFTSKNEAATLMVDGQTGTITQKAPGAGGKLSFQVETGSLKSGWQVTDANNTAATAGVTWTQKGANRGVLEINVPTNITAGERGFSFKVQRLGSDGQIDASVTPVMIEIMQPKSDYLLTVSPSVPQDQEGLVIEAFDPTPAVNPNGISAQKQFTVMLADPENYTWEVTSSFYKDYDAFLTKTTAAAKTTQAQWTANAAVVNTITGAKSGESVWLNVFRTAPGDPTFKGTLTFTAKPNGEGETQSISISVTIKTSCTINDVLIPAAAGVSPKDYFVVADRNVGATQPRIDQDGYFITAGNFSNVANMNITGKETLENTFEQWRGGYYDWTTVTGGAANKTSETFLRTDFFREGQDLTNYDEKGTYSPWYKQADVTKWKVPAQTDLSSYIIPRVAYSKQRPFLVSDFKDLSGNYVGCFFPLAGTGSGPSGASGSYWSSTSSSLNFAYPYSFSTSAASMGSSSTKTNEYSVRCVRQITSEEATQAQSDGYIGEKWQ